MIQTKHILTTSQEPNRLYIPPTIEVVEVEEECVLGTGSPITDEIKNPETDPESNTNPPRPGGRGAKENFIFFNDNFTDESFDEDLDY